MQTNALKKIIRKQQQLLELTIKSTEAPVKYGAQTISNATILNKSPEFIKLNRTFDHLKKTTFSYLKKHQLEELFDLICETYEQECFEDVTISSTQHDSTNQLDKKNVFLALPKKESTFLFNWPIDKQAFWLSSYYGPRKGKMHYAIDLAAIRGTKVFPAAGGIVEECGYQLGYGNTVVIAHPNGLKTRYAHLNKIYVQVDEKVFTTHPLGEVGDTGHTIKSGTDASHLHFEVSQQGKRINPLLFLPAI